jgi:tRNA A37 threonylcarbamoyladenosine dehydratase
MSTKKKKSNPKKVDFLDLSDSEKAHLLKEAKDNLRLKLVEARFWQSLAETEKITINGQTIQFEDINLKGPTYE